MSLFENFDLPSAAVGFSVFALYRISSRVLPSLPGAPDEDIISEEALNAKIAAVAAASLQTQEETSEDSLSEPEGELSPSEDEQDARTIEAGATVDKPAQKKVLVAPEVAEAQFRAYMVRVLVKIFFILNAARLWLFFQHGAAAVAPMTVAAPGLRGSLARSVEEIVVEADVRPVETVKEDVKEDVPEPLNLVLNVSDPRTAAKKDLMSITLTRQKASVKQVGGQLEYRSAYYGTLKLGQPAEDFTFVFDTGSGHLIVPSGYCHSETCKAHKRYKRSKSSSAVDILYDGTPVKPKDPRDQMTVSFGTGEVTGVFVDELVCLDGANKEAAQMIINEQGQDPELPPGCARMRIVTATEMSADPFKDFEFDGVLGLGLDGLSQTPEFNFINIFAGDAIAHGGNNKMFSIFLGKDAEEESKLSLGGYDEDHLDGDVHWNNVIDPELGHWTIRIKSVRMGDISVPFCNEGCKAVMDTGTSLMAVPSNAFSEFYKLLWHRAPLDGECRGPGPELTFELDHGSITVGPEDYARAEKCKRPAKATGFKTNGTYGETRHDMCCRPLLMSMDMPEPVGPKLFIFGEPVLRKYYTVYDAERKRVGVGKAVHQEPSKSEDSSAEDADNSWFWEEDEEEAPASQ